MRKQLKDIDYRILFELVKNSKISDRKLAKLLGVSQPTVTRRRARLEREDLLDYTAIPNFGKLGFEILAFSFALWKPEARAELALNVEEYIEKVKAMLSKYPNVIFLSDGRGLGMDRMAISVHKNYAEYTNFMRELDSDWGESLIKFESFMVDLKGDHILRQFTFKPLLEYIEKIKRTAVE